MAPMAPALAQQRHGPYFLECDLGTETIYTDLL